MTGKFGARSLAAICSQKSLHEGLQPATRLLQVRLRSSDALPATQASWHKASAWHACCKGMRAPAPGGCGAARAGRARCQLPMLNGPQHKQCMLLLQPLSSRPQGPPRACSRWLRYSACRPGALPATMRCTLFLSSARPMRTSPRYDSPHTAQNSSFERRHRPGHDKPMLCAHAAPLPVICTTRAAECVEQRQQVCAC